MELMPLESTDYGFSNLGDMKRTSICFHLELRFELRKKDTSGGIDDFSEAIERLFGLDTRLLEALIMKKSNEKISRRCKGKAQNGYSRFDLYEMC